MKSLRLRRLAVAVAACVLLLVAVAGYLIASFDANAYKQQAIDWMQAEHQRTLAIDGPIELSAFPRLQVKVSGVRLSERDSDQPFVAVSEAALAVRLMPLLQRKLVIDSIAARGVQAHYRRDVDGVRNVDDLLVRADAASAAPAASGSGSRLLQPDISSIRLRDVQLQISDRLAGIDATLALQSFDSGRLADRVASPVALKATIELAGQPPTKLSLDGTARLTLDFEQRGATLDGLQLAVAGDAAGVNGLATTLQGTLAWHAGALRAGLLKIAIIGARFGNTSLAPSQIELERLLFDPSNQRIELDSLASRFAGQIGGSRFELVLDWPRLAVDPQQLNGSALAGRYELTGSSALSGQFKSAAPSGRFDALRIPALAISIDGRAGQRQVTGQLQADALLRVAARSVRLQNVQLKADLSDPALQALQLALRGEIEAAAGVASWNVDGTLNVNRFHSDGTASWTGAVPRITAQARFDSLDLNRLLAPEQTAAAGAPSKAPPPADAPVDFDGLRSVDGQFSLAASRLVFRQFRLDDARVEAELDAGELRISRLAGRSWSGRIVASGSATADSQRVALKLAADGVDINALLRDIADKDLLAGVGRVDATIGSQGGSVGALRSNLAGKLSLQLRDGSVKGINLARALRQAKAALTLQRDALSRSSGTEKTDFSELSASATISGGIATSDDLDLKSPFLRLGGAGRFDIGEGRLDYTARTTLTTSAVGQGGADLAALRGVTIPIALSGPFDAIDWRIGWSDVAASALTKTVKDKLAEKLGARLGIAAPSDAAASAAEPATPREMLEDKLKGLFR